MLGFVLLLCGAGGGCGLRGWHEVFVFRNTKTLWSIKYLGITLQSDMYEKGAQLRLE